MKFDVAGALKAGYSQRAIADYLAEQGGMDITGARAAGHTDDAIIEYLAPNREMVEQQKIGAEGAKAAREAVQAETGFAGKALAGAGSIVEDARDAVGQGAAGALRAVFPEGSRGASLADRLAPDEAAIIERRQMNNTLPGQIGRIAGIAGLSALAAPAGIAQGALLGGGMGALQPTVGDESAVKNTLVGAALGGAGGAVPAVLGALNKGIEKAASGPIGTIVQKIGLPAGGAAEGFLYGGGTLQERAERAAKHGAVGLAMGRGRAPLSAILGSPATQGAIRGLLTSPTVPADAVPMTEAPASPPRRPTLAKAKQVDFAILEGEHGLPEGALNAVMMTESGGDDSAVSPKGARGAFQFMPITAKRYGVNTSDRNSSAKGAARYLADLMDQYDGNFLAALAHYNGGSKQGERVANGKEPSNQETRDYLDRVIGRME